MTVTSMTLLAAFCWAVAAISVGRLLLADNFDGLDWGTTALVVGIAALISAVATVRQPVLEWPVGPVFALLGVLGIGIGAVSIVRGWPL